MEILKARNGKALDIVFACCGGGGLAAGVAAYIKQVRPDVKVTRSYSLYLPPFGTWERGETLTVKKVTMITATANQLRD